jgi:hypothetical protein
LKVISSIHSASRQREKLDYTDERHVLHLLAISSYDMRLPHTSPHIKNMAQERGGSVFG